MVAFRKPACNRERIAVLVVETYSLDNLIGQCAPTSQSPQLCHPERQRRVSVPDAEILHFVQNDMTRSIAQLVNQRPLAASSRSPAIKIATTTSKPLTAPNFFCQTNPFLSARLIPVAPAISGHGCCKVASSVIARPSVWPKQSLGHSCAGIASRESRSPCLGTTGLRQ
jgi:hypothetical protein